MTDNEIIKALECCITPGCDKSCPFKGSISCNEKLMRNTLSLINRQKAEIERLKGWQDLLKAEKHSLIKAEAIKEFAEGLKHLKWSEVNRRITERDIDAITKEMTGDDI